MELARINPTGVVMPADVPPEQVGPEFYNEALNIQFRSGVTARTRGWRAIYGSAGDAPLHVRNSFFNGVNYWLYVSTNSIRVTDSAGTHKIITPGASSTPASNAPSLSEDSNLISSCEINGLPVINFGSSDGPHYWDRDYVTPNIMDPVPDWPASYTCQVIRAFREYLVALNIYDGSNNIPHLVKWSDSSASGIPDDGNGTTWDATASNDAGELPLGDSAEGITDAVEVRDQLLIAKPHSLYLMSYVGGVAIFGRRLFSTSAGALSANCLGEYRGSVVGLGDEDVWITDGQQIKSLINRKARRHLFNELDVENYQKSFVVTNPLKHEVWVCYPQSGFDYCSRALVWNAEENEIAFRDITMGGSGLPHASPGNISEGSGVTTWGGLVGAWSAQTSTWGGFNKDGAVDGLVGIDWDTEELALMDTGTTQDVGTLNSRLRKLTMDFGDPNQAKLLTEVHPYLSGDNVTVNIRVGGQDKPDDPISWNTTQPFKIGTDRFINTRLRANYISIELQSDQDGDWRCSGMGFKVIAAGTRRG